MPEHLGRHMITRTTAPAWTVLMETLPDLATEPLVRDWVKADYPLIVRRGSDEANSPLIPLGLPLPPSHGKRRIAIALAREDLVSITPPPLLVEASLAAPTAWRPILDRLVASFPAVRSFGSLAWQYLTGLPYLSAQSDLDLLWQLPAEGGIDDLISAIAEIAQAAPMRLDGEVIGPAGAVNWREFLPGADREILLKGTHGVRMVTRSAFLTGTVA